MSWIYLNRADLLRCVRGLPDLSRFFSFSHLSGNVESTYEIDDTGAGDVPQYLYQVISTNSKPKPVAGGLPDGLVLRGVTELAFYLSLSLVWSTGGRGHSGADDTCYKSICHSEYCREPHV